MKHIKGFDGLRGVSIILVLLTHLGLFWKLPRTPFFQERVWELIHGMVGVKMFFTLSGFLITRMLLHEYNKFGNIRFGRFYLRRFLRILPPFIFFLLAVFVLMRQGVIWESYNGLLYACFYAYNFVPNVYYTGELGHTWTLAVEEQFYLFWPWILIYTKGKLRVIITILIILLCSIAFFLYPVFEIGDYSRPFRWFVPASVSVFIGSLFAILLNNHDFVMASNSRNKLILILSIILFLSPLYTPWLALVDPVQSFACAFFILWIYNNQDSFLTKTLEFFPIRYLGQISYGVYIFQGIFLTTGPAARNWFQTYPQNILLTFTVAILSFELIERPILKYKRKTSREV